MTYVFISYNRRDTDFVEKLERGLSAREIITWRDVQSIPGGARWFGRIRAGLESSYAVIYIDTANAESSNWLEQEILYAEMLNLPIIPLKLDPQFVSIYTANLNAILCDDTHFEVGLVRLAARLRTLPQQPIKPGATAPPEVTDEATLSDVDEKVIVDYLEWQLVQAQADLRDTLYLDLGATPERIPAKHVPSLLAAGLNDKPFTVSHIGLEQLMHEDFGKPGDDVLDVRRAIRDLCRVVLLGEPGAGKTTTLLKLTVDLAHAAQYDITAKLPLYAPLCEFDGTVSFTDFVRGKAYTLQDHFDALLRAGRFVLLCDALNEMPRKGCDGRDLIAEVRDYLQDKPDWVVSCRVRDYQEDLNGIVGVGKIRLKPLDPPRIEEFIRRKYADTPERGAALWQEIGGSEKLLAAWKAFVWQGAPEGFWGDQWLPKIPSLWSEEERAWRAMHADYRHLLPLCRNPFIANVVCALYRRSAVLPENRAGLFADFVDNLLTHERVHRDAIGFEWIGDEPIRIGMGQVAWAMGAQTEITRTAAEAILREHLPDYEPAQILSAAAAAQIIDYGTSVRFSHQLLQQYFAARVLGALLDVGTDPAAIWKPDHWWESTGREAAAVLLASDGHDPEGVARWLAPAQPELARELLTPPNLKLDLAQIDPTTKAVLVEGASGKIGDAAPEARAAAYRILGSMRADTRRGVGVVNGLPQIEWCAIPGEDAGETFTFGEGESAQQLAIPYRFWIAKYPVTYAQYEPFVASDGYTNMDYWTEAGWYGKAKDAAGTVLERRAVAYPQPSAGGGDVVRSLRLLPLVQRSATSRSESVASTCPERCSAG